MANSKVSLFGETLIDLTSDTVTSDKMAYGITAHKADGTAITGTAVITYDATEEGVILPNWVQVGTDEEDA